MAATLITASKGANWHSKGGQLRVSGPLWSTSSILVAPFAKGANYLATQSTDLLKECHVNIAGPLWKDHVATFEVRPHVFQVCSRNRDNSFPVALGAGVVTMGLQSGGAQLD